MRLNPKFILLISVMCATLAGYMLLDFMKKANQPNEFINVVIAMQDFEVGDRVDPGEIRLLAAPKGFDVQKLFLTKEAVIGRIARNPIRRGTPIQIFDLIDDSDGLSSLIPNGYRASTISLNLPKTNLRFLKFGSRVDILFTNTNKKSNAPKMTQTIMKNVLVMKLDEGKSNSQGNKVDVSLTLAVPPEAAEVLAYTNRNGRLDIVVRPSRENGIKEEYMGLNDILGIKNLIGSVKPEPTEMELIRGTKKEMVRL